jgi:hypothetical protein
MIAPAVLAAFFIGVLVEATFLFVWDRRAIREEQAFWDDLRAQAALGYGQVFDWEQDQ